MNPIESEVILDIFGDILYLALPKSIMVIKVIEIHNDIEYLFKITKTTILQKSINDRLLYKKCL